MWSTISNHREDVEKRWKEGKIEGRTEDGHEDCWSDWSKRGNLTSAGIGRKEDSKKGRRDRNRKGGTERERNSGDLYFESR